jgi:hypothetical protein
MKLNKLFILALTINLVIGSTLNSVLASTQDLGKGVEVTVEVGNQPNTKKPKRDLLHWLGVGATVLIIGEQLLNDTPDTSNTSNIEEVDLNDLITYVPKHCIDSNYTEEGCPDSEESALAQGYSLPESKTVDCVIYQDNIISNCSSDNSKYPL